MTDSSPKIKFQKLGSGIHPNFFIRLGVFSPFLERKKVGKFCTFGCFNNDNKRIFSDRPTDPPKHSEISLEGNTTMFFFGLTCVPWRRCYTTGEIKHDLRYFDRYPDHPYIFLRVHHYTTSISPNLAKISSIFTLWLKSSDTCCCNISTMTVL